MPETVYNCPKIDCVRVDSFGEISYEEVLQSVEESAFLLNRHQSSHLIVDVRQQAVALELVDTYHLCSKLLKKLPKDLKIAYIVNDPPQKPHRFFKLVSEGMGYPVKAFTTIDGALAWLKDKDPSFSYKFNEKVKFSDKV